jgi:hypothetical protein
MTSVMLTMEAGKGKGNCHDFEMRQVRLIRRSRKSGGIEESEMSSQGAATLEGSHRRLREFEEK